MVLQDYLHRLQLLLFYCSLLILLWPETQYSQPSCGSRRHVQQQEDWKSESVAVSCPRAIVTDADILSALLTCEQERLIYKTTEAGDAVRSWVLDTCSPPNTWTSGRCKVYHWGCADHHIITEWRESYGFDAKSHSDQDCGSSGPTIWFDCSRWTNMLYVICHMMFSAFTRVLLHSLLVLNMNAEHMNGLM